jgi:hypothetical protein
MCSSRHNKANFGLQYCKSLKVLSLVNFAQVNWTFLARCHDLLIKQNCDEYTEAEQNST